MISTADLPHRVTVRVREGTTGTGDPAFARPVRGVPARVDGRRRTVRTGTGAVVIASATATIRPGVNVTVGSLIEHDTRLYEVLDVSEAVEYRRVDHVDLLLDGPRPVAS